MQRPIVCVGALVSRPDNKFLIVQTTKWRGLWGVAGGKVEWGETLEQAVTREFLEETGLRLHDLRYAQTQEAVLSHEFHSPSHMLLIDFFARTEQFDIVPNEEITQWDWIDLTEAEKYPLNSYTKTLIELARGRS